jgi:hypothetical protein
MAVFEYFPDEARSALVQARMALMESLEEANDDDPVTPIQFDGTRVSPHVSIASICLV